MPSDTGKVFTCGIGGGLGGGKCACDCILEGLYLVCVILCVIFFLTREICFFQNGARKQHSYILL